MKTIHDVAVEYGRLATDLGLEAELALVASEDGSHAVALRNKGEPLGTLMVSGPVASHSLAILDRRPTGTVKVKPVAVMGGLPATKGGLDKAFHMLWAWTLDRVQVQQVMLTKRAAARGVVGPSQASIMAAFVNDLLLASVHASPDMTADQIALNLGSAREIVTLLDTVAYPDVDLSNVDRLMAMLDHRHGAKVEKESNMAGRSDLQVVAQTEQLARLVLRAIGTGYDVPEDHVFHVAEDPRSVTAWQHACAIQEILTNTDASDAVLNLDADEDDDLADRLSEALESLPEYEGGRSDREIVDQTEEIAKVFLSMRGLALSGSDAQACIRYAQDPRAQQAWSFAKEVQEMMTFTEVDDALSNVEEDEMDVISSTPFTPLSPRT